VKNGKERGGTVAALYGTDGIPAVAFFTIQSESGDWILYATYYFRPTNGSLAKRHEQLNTFFGNASVIRDSYFGCRGEVYGGTARHLDLETQAPKAPEPQFIDERAPLFKRVQSLPFFSALKRHD
jgi:hypothetical protein